MDSIYLEAFESLPGLVCLVDASTFVIQNCNTLFEETMNLEKSQINSMSFVDFIVKPSDKSYLQLVVLDKMASLRHEFDEMGMGHEEGRS